MPLKPDVRFSSFNCTSIFTFEQDVILILKLFKWTEILKKCLKTKNVCQDKHRMIIVYMTYSQFFSVILIIILLYQCISWINLAAEIFLEPAEFIDIPLPVYCEFHSNSKTLRV